MVFESSFNAISSKYFCFMILMYLFHFIPLCNAANTMNGNKKYDLDNHGKLKLRTGSWSEYCFGFQPKITTFNLWNLYILQTTFTKTTSERYLCVCICFLFILLRIWRHILQLYHDDGCLFCGANCCCAQLPPSNSRNTRHANMGKTFVNINHFLQFY